MATKQEIQRLNQAVFEQLEDPGMYKHAADAIKDYTRVRIREGGILRNIIPIQQVTNDDFDRQIHTAKPVIIVDKEPENPPAMSVAFGGQPIIHWVRGPRYMVGFHRIVGPRFMMDTIDLRTWDMDIRQIISDNAIKDMQAEEDARALASVNTALIAQGSAVPHGGAIQWQSIPGITRDTWMESLKVMPSTPYHLHPTRVLMNNVTIYDFQKWGRDEIGGDMAEKILRDGWGETELDGKKILISNKRDLLPDGTVYHFADPKFLGKFFQIEDVTMFMKREFWIMEFFPYEEVGMSWGHTGGLARVDHA